MKKILLLATVCMWMFQGCQNSDSSDVQLSVIPHDQLVDEVKLWYADSPPTVQKDPRGLNSPLVFWDQAKTHRVGKDRYLITVPLMSKDPSGRSVFNLIAFREKGTLKGFITEVIPSKEFTYGTNRSQFSGQVKLLTKSGKKLRTQKFVDGKEVEFYKNSTSTQRTAQEDWQTLEEVVVIAVIPNDDYIVIWVSDYWTYDYPTDDDDWYPDDDYWYYEDFNNDGVVDTGIPFPTDITNNIDDPCIRQLVTEALSDGNAIGSVINANFTASEDYIMVLNQSNSLPDSEDAHTQPHSSGNLSFLSVTITFNANVLPGTSYEYIYATALHEFLHATMHCSASNPSQTSESAQHEAMADPANSYVSQMANALQDRFPGLSSGDATNLAWAGLQGTAAWNNHLNQAQRDAIVATNTAYKRGGAGTHCPW